MRHRKFTWSISLGLVLCARGLGDKPTIRVTPQPALVDDVLDITAVGLDSKKAATIRLSMTDANGREWVSEAEYPVDGSGLIAVARTAPLSGSYTGIDPMGLIWSAKLGDSVPAEQREPGVFVVDAGKPISSRLELRVEGQTVATHEITRSIMGPGVEKIIVREDGMVGELYKPQGVGPYPGLLVLSGSDGGIKRADAALLASRGYAAFALAYFREEGIPQSLVEIPLEYLKKGVDWLGRQQSVDPKRIGVIGGSRGGELALLLGATYPDIRAVVAYVPSHVVWQGLSWNGPPPDKSSWTLGDQPVPYLRGRPGPEFFSQFSSGKPICLLSLFVAGLEDAEAAEAAAISVEKINGPVLLISGREDQMWPSSLMADKVVERLKKHNHPFPFEHLAYPGAGHGIRKSFLPAAGTVSHLNLALGGTEEANAKAQADSWPKVLQFLRSHLKG